jgi:predicted lipid-binding transport protein (Tim44 family)
MKKLWLSLIMLMVAVTLAVDDASAKRLGGGRSIGQQRQNVAPRPSAPEAAPQPAPSQAAPVQRSGMSRWLGPLAGLAIGLGLAGLFGHEMGNLIAAMLLAGVVVAAVAFVLRMIARGRPSAAAAGANGSQYSGFGDETVAAPPPSQAMTQPIVAAALMNPRGRIPEGFNVDGFLREAKKNFIEMYAAHDRNYLDALKEFTTDEMFAELRQDIDARGLARQSVDIVTLSADLLEVVTEADTHWSSIRFSGMLREDRNATPTSFEEIWNLRKPARGTEGWVLAGIQQVN